MNRSTWLGTLFRRDRAAARAELLDGIARSRGNVRRLAFLLDLSRRHVMRLLSRERLWLAVEEARARRREPEWLLRTRLAMGVEERALDGAARRVRPSSA